MPEFDKVPATTMGLLRTLGRPVKRLLGFFGLTIHLSRNTCAPTAQAPADDGFRDIFLSPWTDAWKTFFIDDPKRVGPCMERLKSGMDEDSKKVIDTLWEKIIYLIPYNRHKQSYRYKYSDFFTPEEIAEQAKGVDIGGWKLPAGASIEPSVFINKNGLAFLDEDVTATIKGKAIIDGGAYVGDSALVFIEYGPSKIYSFEPVDSLFEKTLETLRLNRVADKIEPVKLGLGDCPAELTIYPAGSSSSLQVRGNEPGQKIRVITLDDFVKERNIRVGLIKLDVEGSELATIQGALGTIKRDKPILLISVYHRPEDFFYIKPLIDGLDAGYRFIMRKTSPFRVTSETVLIGYVPVRKESREAAPAGS